MKKVIFLFLGICLLSACTAQKQRTRTSIMDYLYPNKGEVSVKPSIPHLNVPLQVGIAFVPDRSSSKEGFSWSGHSSISGPTEAQKSKILESVSERFRSLEFVKELKVIPSAYITAEGGFDNLDQLQTMFGIDVVALVSYDQVQFSDEGKLSLAYWTIVGAYVVSGTKNDTSTMLDTAVYDISSRKMLFRAPGTSTVRGKATPVNLNESLREDSIKGFSEAASEMASNLEIELAKFKEKIKSNPEAAKVTYSKGYSGSLGELFLLMILILPVAFSRKLSVHK